MAKIIFYTFSTLLVIASFFIIKEVFFQKELANPVTLKIYTKLLILMLLSLIGIFIAVIYIFNTNKQNYTSDTLEEAIYNEYRKYEYKLDQSKRQTNWYQQTSPIGEKKIYSSKEDLINEIKRREQEQKMVYSPYKKELLALGINEEFDQVSLIDIKRAFKKKALELHPDISKKDTSLQMQTINEFYKILKNAKGEKC